MSTPLEIATFGMAAQQTRVDVIANNMANMNTTGYQRQRADFSDLLYSQEDRPGSTKSRAEGDIPGGFALGRGVTTGGVYRIIEQGQLKTTGNALDLAIQGDGYFAIAQPDGTTGYTRSGSFSLNQSGEIVTQDGLPLQGGISVPQDARDIQINASGEVLALVGDDTQPTLVGQLQLARFANESGLELLGNNLFAESPRSGVPTLGLPGRQGFGTVSQGFLEASNVNPISEISRMIAAMRAYDMNSKVFQTADQMMAPPSQR